MRPFNSLLLQRIPQVRRPLGVLAALGVVAGCLAVAQAYVIARLVVALVERAPLTGPTVAVVVVFALRALVSGGQEVVAARAAETCTTAVRRRWLARWLRLPAEQRVDSDDAVTVGTEGVSALVPYITRYLPALVTAAVVPPLAVLALLTTDWLSALVVILTLPLLPLFAALIGQHTQDAVDQRWAGSVRLAGHFLDVVKGLPTLVGYQRAEVQAAQVERVGQQYRRATMGTLRIALMSAAALELLATLSVAVVAVTVGLRLAGGSIPLQVGLTAILLAPEAYWPIRRVGQEFHAAADGVRALDALLGEPDAPERATDVEPEQVTVRGLGYRYPGGADVLRDVTFTLGPGLTVITGESGCGKTTLLEVLAGVRTPSAGEVEAPHAHLVTQRPYVAPATVADNLALGVGAGGEDDLPPGVAREQLLGDDGFGLSAGQRARLALARAERSDAHLLLVDEPTAHLDAEAATDLRARLRRLARERIVVVVSHDPDVAADADAVIHLSSAGGDHPAPLRNAARQLAPTKPAKPDQTSGDETPGGQLTPAREAKVRGGIVGAGLLGMLASASGVALTATSGWLIVRASERPIMLTLIIAIVLVRTFGVTRPAFRYAERLRAHDAALADLVHRRTSAYRQLIPLTPARLGRRRRADLLTGFVRDLDDEVDAQVRVVSPVIGICGTALLATALVALVLPQAALVLLALTVLVAAMALAAFRAEQRQQPALVAARARVRGAVHLATTSTTELQAISATDWAMDRLEEADRSERPLVRAHALVRAASTGSVLVVTGLATALMTYVVAGALADGRVDAPFAALLLLTPLALGELLGGVPDLVTAATTARAASDRVRALLDQEPAVTDTGTGRLDRPEGHLATTNASATWDHDVRIPLPDIDIRPGEHVAVTGPNGCGKSTLVAVLARHLDPAGGTVRLDDTDVRTVTVDDVRCAIAVLDEPHVFAGTLRANLLLARPGASDSELEQALGEAGLDRWYATLTRSLDAALGQGGTPLSGGEQSRLGLARALLSGRPVLLLDEPVAHLDQPTARRVLADLRAGGGSRTVLVATHQPLAEDYCDSVLRWDSARTQRQAS